MRKFAVALLCLIFGLSTKNVLYAQNYVYSVGSPTFSTQIPIENGFINVNNGEIHIEIPLATHAQRGRLQLDERLIYDSRIWKIGQNGNYFWTPTNIPNSMGGWVFSSGSGSGTISYDMVSGMDSSHCLGGASYQPFNNYFAWFWTDPQGTSHSFYNVNTVQYEGTSAHCLTLPVGTPSATGFASDGSGYSIAVSNYTTPVIHDSQGNSYYPTLVANFPPPSSNLIADSNGNAFTVDANGNLVDTLGRTPVLTSSSGNQIYYDVLGYNGARSRYTVTTESVSYSTAFSQQAVGEASGSFTAIKSIQLPDGTSYSFTYDSGASPGNYGELTSLTLPTGGVIQYGYANFFDSFQNMNRWLHTRVKDGGTTTFTPTTISNCTSSAGCEEKTTVTNPANNDTVYTFSLDPSALKNANSWVTEVDAYQGAASSGTKLESVSTSYTYDTYDIALPTVGSNQGSIIGNYQVPASTATTTTLSSVGLSTETQIALYSLAGTTASMKQWDYYSGTLPASPTIETDYTYYKGAFPSQVTTKDGTGNLISQTTYGYDETTPTVTSGLPNHIAVTGSRANPTTTTQWANSGTTIATTAAYDDAGTLLSSTSPNGTTTYAYDATDTFVTSTTVPTPSSGVQMITKATNDTQSGAPITSVGANSGQTTTYSQYDSLLRPQLVTLPNNGQVTYSYSPNQVGIGQTVASGVKTDTETLFDAYGRKSRVAVANGSASNPWYQTDSCYNSVGQLQFQSAQYAGTGWPTPMQCSGAGDTYSYDALGRTTSVGHADGSSDSMSYTGRAVLVTSSSGVKKIVQSDGLGRPSAVCELSSNASMPNSGAPTSCGMDIAGTGFLTTYSYDLANHKTTITQGAQTRVFQTDWLGRTTLVQEPESGATTYGYAYNSIGLVVTRARPTANQPNPSVLTTTTTQYDTLGRLVSIGYSDGTPAKNYYYDQATNWGSVSLGSSKGQLTYAAAANDSGMQFTYDVMGNITQTGQCMPDWCGNPAHDVWQEYSYDLARQMISEQYASATLNYGYNLAGQLVSMTGGQNNAVNAPLIYSVQSSGPFGPIVAQFGNGLQAPYQYDAAGRQSGGWICAGTNQQYCGSGTQLYGFTVSVTGNHVVSSVDTVLNRISGYGYDEFGRLSNVTPNLSQNVLSMNFTYDRYGNRLAQAVSNGGVAEPQPNLSVNVANNQVVGNGYDAVGNMISDGVHSYQYDADNNLVSIDNGTTATYVYDALNHRVKVVANGVTERYGFDIAGRRSTSWEDNSTSLGSVQYYAGAQPVAYWTNSNIPAGPAGYIYCSGENGTCSFTGNGTVAFGANGQFNYLSSSNGMSCNDATFGDPTPGTVKACFYQLSVTNPPSPPNSAYTYCSAENGTCSFASTGTVAFGVNGQFSYLPASGGIACNDSTFVDPAFGSAKACFYSPQQGSIHFEHQDWLGTERLRTSFNGTVESDFTSLPFGDALTSSGGDTNQNHFAMLDHDAESSSEHATFRQYSSTQGRWFSPDPYRGSYDLGNPQSLNRYTYALNNPLWYRDPSGLICSTTQSVTVNSDGSQSDYATSALACGFWDAVEAIAGGIGTGFADFGHDIAGFFGFGHASFKGSIKPRPGVGSGAGAGGAIDPDAARIQELARGINAGAGALNNPSTYAYWYVGSLVGAGGALWTGAVGGVEVAGQFSILPETYSYSDKVLADAAQDLYHAVPDSIVNDVIQNGDWWQGGPGQYGSPYTQFYMPGSVNGAEGIFEVGGHWVTPNNLWIVHTLFRPF